MSLPPLSEVASAYGGTILDAIRTEYPNAPRHVMTGPDDQVTPRSAHPAFYGCFDWHSAVEMHWALVRLLRLTPAALDASTAFAVLDEHLSATALATETDYVASHPGWERPYGYAWVLALAAELEQWTDPRARRWARSLHPLAEAVARGLQPWLANNRRPDRGGAHSNSAFALLRALPWARAHAADHPDLLAGLRSAADRWFGADRDYPAGWEPSSADFLSPALTEAQLISALTESTVDFADWLTAFLPGLATGAPANLLQPAEVGDTSDGQMAHLHGLNLYRAHAFDAIAGRLPADDPRRTVLTAAADRHAQASLPVVVGDDWMVEHWLAAYAVLLLAGD